MKKRILAILLALSMVLPLLPTAVFAIGDEISGTELTLPAEATITEVASWDELKNGIEGISADGAYAFQVTGDLIADEGIQFPTTRLTYQVYLYCDAQKHTIGRDSTFMNAMFYIGKNSACYTSATFVLGGINGGQLTIDGSPTPGAGIIYGYGGIGENSAVELYDGVIFENNITTNSVWEFAGWKTDDGRILTNEEVLQLPIDSNTTFTAQYSNKSGQNTYVVNFNKGTTHGSLSGTTSFSLNAGDKLTELPTTQPLSSSFAFECWIDETGNTYTNEDILNMEINRDITFSARWKKTDGTITVVFSNKGTGFNRPDGDRYYGDFLFAFAEPNGYISEENVPLPKTVSSLTFSGWRSLDGTLYTTEELLALPITEQLVLTPQYDDANGRITLTFDAGLHGTVSPKTVTLDEPGTMAGQGVEIPTVRPASFIGGNLIYTNGSNYTVRMYGGEIRNNETYTESSGGTVNAFNFEMHGGAITNNKVYGTLAESVLGGGVNCYSLTMTAGLISDNLVQANDEGAVAYGGGLFVGTSKITKPDEEAIVITGGTITNNRALGADGTPTGEGGGICFYSTNYDDTVQIQLKNVQITNNQAGFGGGIACTDNNPDTSAEDGSALILGEGCVISQNIAQYGGGGVFFIWETASLLLEGADITYNQVTTTETMKSPFRSRQPVRDMLCGGGGILLGTESGTIVAGDPRPAAFTMTSGAVDNNTSNTNGGGIAADKASAQISGGSIQNNESGQGGGGIYWDSTGSDLDPSSDVVLSSQIVLANNRAKNGGGIYLNGDGVIGNHLKFLTLSVEQGAQITNNSATENGGAIYCGTKQIGQIRYPSYTLVTGGQITGNTAGNAGGGIYNLGVAMISGGTFGNTATALPTSGEIYHNGLTAQYAPLEGWDSSPADSLFLSGGVTLTNGIYLETNHVIDIAEAFTGSATVDMNQADTDKTNVDGTYQSGRNVVEYADGLNAPGAAEIGRFPLAQAVSEEFTLQADPQNTKILELYAEEETYGVLYEFKSGTRGAKLPNHATTPEMPELPVDSKTYAMGETVTAIQPGTLSFTGPKSDSSNAPMGTWTFKGYDADTKVVSEDTLKPGKDPDDTKEYIIFTGTWIWEETTYGVLYEFKSGTRGAKLPNHATTPEMPELPVDSKTYAMGKTVTAIQPGTLSFTGPKSDSPNAPMGTWTFKGYDADTKVVSEDTLKPGKDPDDTKEYIIFTGTWIWEEMTYGVLYEFETATEGTELPNHATTPEMPELPVDSKTYAMGKTVTAIQPGTLSFTGPRDSSPNAPMGTWTFNGYDADTKVVSEDTLEPGKDPGDTKEYIIFTGFWTWEKLEDIDITLIPQDMTSYTGGNSISGDPFPTARYQINADDSVDLSTITFTVNGQAQTLPAGTRSGDILLLPWLEETFTLKESASMGASTLSEEADNDVVAGEYEIGIRLEDVSPSAQSGADVNLTCTPGTLTVRYVSDPEGVLDTADPVDIAQPVVNKESEVNTEDGIGVALIPEGTHYYTNGKAELGVLGDNESDAPQISLLFDNLLPGEQGQDTQQLLIDRAKEEGHTLTEENSEFKYLDLINENDGNAWVSTGNGTTITIYWPCPEGVTAENFTAQVLHFKGLHREYRGNLENQIQQAQIEVINASISDGNIIFTLTGNQTAGSFSPFAVVWQENEPEKINISVTKEWEDEEDQDGMRPDSVTVKLFANKQDTNMTLTLDKAHNWQGAFTNVDETLHGVAIDYTVQEVAVNGYTSSITGNAKNGFVITNTHTPQTIDISGAKTWIDANDQDGLRPDSITIRLLANGKEAAHQEVTKGDGWKWTFAGMPEYANGVKITYTISEDRVEGYTATVDGYNVTNTHIPTISISGSKTWDDANDQDGKRPDSITIRLLANGKEVAHQEVTAVDGWKWTFANVPEYENDEKITYTITEDQVTGYQSEVDGFDVTNHYTPGKVNVTVTKSWRDYGNAERVRPYSVIIKLLANGKETGEKLILNRNNQWTGSFDDLDEYVNGEKIVYTVTEERVIGYTASISGSVETGFIVTNTYTPGKPEPPQEPGKPTTPEDTDKPESSDQSQETEQPEEQQPPEEHVPQTGDRANLGLWIALLALSGAGLTTTLILVGRKRLRTKHTKP